MALHMVYCDYHGWNEIEFMAWLLEMLHFFELLYTLVIIDIPFLLCMDDCGMH